MLKKTLIILAIIGATFAIPIVINSDNVSANQCNIVNRRGCCSHHNGVCGCSHKRALCCDGTLSPSCGCD